MPDGLRTPDIVQTSLGLREVPVTQTVDTTSLKDKAIHLGAKRTETGKAADGTTDIRVTTGDWMQVREYLHPDSGQVVEQVGIKFDKRDPDQVEKVVIKSPDSLIGSYEPLKTRRVIEAYRVPENGGSIDIPDGTRVIDTHFDEDGNGSTSHFLNTDGKSIGHESITLGEHDPQLGRRRLKSRRVHHYGKGLDTYKTEEEYDDAGRRVRNFKYQVKQEQGQPRVVTKKETTVERQIGGDLEGRSETGQIHYVDTNINLMDQTGSDEPTYSNVYIGREYSHDDADPNARLLAKEESTGTKRQKVEFKYTESGKLIRAELPSPDGRTITEFFPERSLKERIEGVTDQDRAEKFPLATSGLGEGWLPGETYEIGKRNEPPSTETTPPEPVAVNNDSLHQLEQARSELAAATEGIPTLPHRNDQ